jgi:hypothetical protein
VSTTSRLDVGVGQVVNRVIVQINLKQLGNPLSSESLLLTHKHEPNEQPVSVHVDSGVEHSDPVGDIS